MKFNIVKKLSLDFVGEGWEEAYLCFRPLTISEVKDRIPKFANIDTKDSESIQKGFEETMSLLQDKFIEGKALGENGLQAVTKKDLSDFPIDVMTRALNFLSQASSPKTDTEKL